MTAFASVSVAKRCCQMQFQPARAHERFGDAVLLGVCGRYDLLCPTVAARERAVELEGINERVVRPQHHADVAIGQDAEPPQECVFERPGGFLGIVALTDVPADALTVGGVQDPD